MELPLATGDEIMRGLDQVQILRARIGDEVRSQIDPMSRDSVTRAVKASDINVDQVQPAVSMRSAASQATPRSPRLVLPKKPARDVKIHLEPVHVDRSFGNMIKALWEAPEISTNFISTSRYSILTFLPKNLFMQFTRLANLYFAIIAALQLIPGLSPTSWFTTVLPLAFVLLFNAIKEAYDDYWRHKSDDEINGRQVIVLHAGGLEKLTAWKDVMVGDLVKVKEHQEVPADLVLLASSDEDGQAQTETANLDGETNLKTKFCFSQTSKFKSADDFSSFAEDSLIRCESPSAKLYVFDGSIVQPSSELPLTADNLLLRGVTLRKTDWVIGAVIYAGDDSRIMMNRTESPRKVTQIERHMNVLVLFLFAILIAVSMLLAMAYILWEQQKPDQWYLQLDGSWPWLGINFGGWIIQVIRFMILLYGVIPISLYITLEIIKIFQCIMVFNSDLLMYHKETDIPFNCRTTTLNEDLGQVQYILSDKTGTLTQNVMGFVWASINGDLYGKADASSGPPPFPHPKHIPPHTAHSLAFDPQMQQKLGASFASLANGTPVDPKAKPPPEEVSSFFIHLALCNTVVPGRSEDGSIVYQASSPDEEALVQGAAYMSYELLSRSSNRIVTSYHGQQHEYEILAVLEFNSDRKRMSVIVKEMGAPAGRILLLCKGADTMIMARIKGSGAIVPTVRKHLEEASLVGYRTLCIAQKELTQQQYDEWNQMYSQAQVAVSDREGAIAAASEKIECDMDLIGATAVEDKLQEGVPEAIESLSNAGIKVWVLTGDKVETAINIAMSCRLFDQSMALVELRERDFNSCMTDDEGQAQILLSKMHEVEEEDKRMKSTHGFGSNVGLVVEGGALALMLHPQHQDNFVKLCSSCKSVVCCRVSPMQKANVTKLVQQKLKAIVLGIGDGANDVGMIQAAHIGCGISGREGRAAVMASDFSFAQFRYLARLLLFHGRMSYKRNAEAVIYSFYKNWAMNVTFVCYAFVSAFSTQPIYTAGLIATINLFWSSYVIVAYAVIEQDVSASTAMKHPALYRETMTFTRRNFMLYQLWYNVQATWHGLVIYFLCMYTMYNPNRSGVGADWVEIGCTMYMALVITINLKLSMKTRNWTWITHLLTWLSVLTLFVYYYFYGLAFPILHQEGTANMADIAVRVYTSPQFWLAGCLLVPIMCLIPDFVYDNYVRLLYPKPYVIFQEQEVMEEAKNQVVRELGLVSPPRP